MAFRPRPNLGDYLDTIPSDREIGPDGHLVILGMEMPRIVIIYTMSQQTERFSCPDMFVLTLCEIRPLIIKQHWKWGYQD